MSLQTPTQEADDYWIYAERKTGKYPEHTVHGGKWLIFVSHDRIDRMWTKIKTATEEGRLGGMAKAATAKVNPSFPISKVKVICVYTYNWKDEPDVTRIREELRKIGITHKISYKTDEDTLQGKYRKTVSRLSKYYQ